MKLKNNSHSDQFELNDKVYSTFKEYYNDFQKVIKESPYLKIKNVGRGFDSEILNLETFKDELKRGKLKIIDKFICNNVTFTIYEQDTFPNSKQLYIVDTIDDNQLVAGVFGYHIIDTATIQETGVWQKKEYRGLMQNFYLLWIFKYWKTLISDNEHSQYAKQFWLSLFNKANGYNLKPFIMDSNVKSYIDDLNTDQYYGAIGKEDIVLGLEKG